MGPAGWTTLGLSLDALGVVLVFRFWAGPENHGQGEMLVFGGVNKRRYTRFRFAARLGIGLILAGFGFQAIGAIMA